MSTQDDSNDGTGGLSVMTGTFYILAALCVVFALVQLATPSAKSQGATVDDAMHCVAEDVKHRVLAFWGFVGTAIFGLVGALCHRGDMRSERERAMLEAQQTTAAQMAAMQAENRRLAAAAILRQPISPAVKKPVKKSPEEPQVYRLD